METTTDTITKSRKNPFPGLRPFKYDEEHLYFGRETQVGDVLDKLMDNHFVAIIGASGIGKSSFMYCGLFPTLKTTIHDDLATEWEIFSFVPGESPIYNLSQTLAKDSQESKTQEEIEQTLRGNKDGLSTIIRDKYERENKNYLVFIDQFEELFRFKDLEKKNEEETQHFINTFLEAKTQRDIPIFVVLTMRSEFIGDCSQYPILTNTINSSQFLIPHMTRDEKKQAIIRPIEVMGASIETNLVEKILDDIGKKQDQLPIMQHALMRTWDNWKKIGSIRGENIGISDYNAIGGVKEALSNHADEVYSGLNEQEKEICEKMFRVITEKSETGRGIRSPNTLVKIASITGYSIPEITKVVDRFRREDTGLLMPPAHEEIDENSKIDISHESLMRIWGMLKIWVEKETESAKRYVSIAEKAELYQKGETSFLVPPELTLATAWRDEEAPTKSWALMYHPTFERTMLFIQESEDAHKKAEDFEENKRRRNLAFNRKIAIGASIGLLFALFLAIFAISQSSEAQRQATAAEKAKDKAKEKEKIALEKEGEAREATKQAKANEKKAKKAQKKAKQESIRATEEKERAVTEQIRAAKAEKRALVLKSKAEDAEGKARLAEESAKLDATIAELEKIKARLAEHKAHILKMFSLAKSMALKSVGLPTTEKTLVAQQAMAFYHKYGEKENPNNADIYRGLYYAIQSQKKKEAENTSGAEAKKHRSYNNLADPAYQNVKPPSIRSIASLSNVIYTTNSAGQTQAWDLEDKSWNEVAEVKPTLINTVTNKVNKALTVSDNGNMAIAGDYPYILYGNTSGNFKKLFLHKIGSNGASSVWYLAFNQQGDKLISADNKNQITIWENSKPTLIQSNFMNQQILAIVAHPSKNQMIVSRKNGQAGMLSMIDLNSSNPEEKLLMNTSGEEIHITSLIFGNHRQLITGSSNGLVTIWDFQNNKLNKATTLRGHSAQINQMAINPKYGQLATASFDGSIRIWSLEHPTKSPIVLDDHKAWVWSISFTKDGESLIAGYRDNVIKVRPTQLDAMSNLLCDYINRDMNDKEWETYVGKDVEYLDSCE